MTCWICGEADPEKVGVFGYEDPLCDNCFRRTHEHCPRCGWDAVCNTEICSCRL